ncbi:myb/SANT-like DNA-binding domain-containing protein 3 [Stegodyphus dumicola]|uniref:myb/SANT-like DNA-binding domain-containing protein 3 n=1 Tax=Stegodyphus dumicola TaxID=202533 RepID=UPI0015AD3F17|nr:myb/SANT-like DNA-binding domain-containing protein 3 [Stegodyphus dumicola]
MIASSVWSMSESKRQNFTLLEKSALAECIIKYKHIIENKTTDAVTNKQKQDAWNSIAEKFNRIPGVTLRSVKQLNFCYKNLKRKAKKRKAYEIELRNGGCPTVTHEDDAINETLFAVSAATSSQKEVFEWVDNFLNVQTSDSEEGNLEKDANNLEKDNSGNAPDEITEKAIVPVEQQPVLHVISPGEATKSSSSQVSKTQKHEVYSPL